MHTLPESNSMIATSFQKARLGIQTIIVAIILGLVLLIVEHLYFEEKVKEADQREQEINVATTELFHLDEQLTMNAAMAIHTGEKKWLHNYDINIKKLDDVMDKIETLVPEKSLHQYQDEIKYINSALVGLEVEAFKYVEEGKLDKAKNTFYSQEYNGYKTDFNNATIKFVSVEKARIQSDLRIYTLMANTFEIASIILTAIILLFVWRMVSSNMKKSEQIFTEAEAEIRHSAHHDHLTGLPNRGFLISVLNEQIKIAEKKNKRLAVLVMDLDKFKPVNDKYGHLVGDVVLKEFAKRMVSTFGDEALCSRLGGDEFVCLLSNENDVNNAMELANKFINIAKKPIITSGVSLNVGTSVGISFFSEHGTDCDSLLYHADIALYEVKKLGRGSSSIYDPSMEEDQDEVSVANRHFRTPNNLAAPSGA